MMTLAKSIFIIFISLSLISCGEGDGEVDARKATDGASQPDVSNLSVFSGFVENQVGSDTNCPTGEDAELRLNFIDNSISFELPTGMGPYTNLNNTLSEENGTLNLNQGARSFAVIYTLNDPTNTFDNGTCSDAGDYTQILELNLNGLVSTTGTYVSNAQSTISIRCGNGETRPRCTGFFTGITPNF